MSGNNGESRRVLLCRRYWHKDFAPYRNMVHTLDDEKIEQWHQLSELFDEADIDDGDEFEIVVRKTGNRPHPNHRWELTKPHTYERVER